MKPVVVISAGIAGALFFGSVTFNVWQCQDRERLEVEIASLQQRSSRPAGERSAGAPSRASRDSDVNQAQISIVLPPVGPTLDPANSAMIGYLGEPVPPPADLNPKYAATAMKDAFQALCDARGVTVEKLGVDTAEFPYVVYGILENGREFLRQIDAELRSMPGYAYAGSVTGGTRSGSSYFALNMIPNSELPRDQSEAIRRRLMLRLQMLAAIWTDPPP